MKLLLVFLLALACFGQGLENVPLTGTVNQSAAKVIPPVATFGSPPSSPPTGAVYIFTDAVSLGTCTGGGSAKATCRWSGSAWEATGGGGGGGGISALTGDVTASGTGSVTTTLSTVNGNVGACGDATHVGQVTLDGKGRATGCTALAIAAGSPLVTPVAVSSGDTSTVIPYGVTLSDGAIALPSCRITSTNLETQAWLSVSKTTTTMTINWSPNAGFTGSCTAVLGGAVGAVGPMGPIGAGNAPYSCGVTAVSSIACTHSLGTSTPWVVCYDAGGNMLGSTASATSLVSVVATSSNIATLTFSGTTTAACSISTGSMGAAGGTGPAGPMPDPGGNGFMVRTALNTDVARTLQAGSGISITNPTGVGGDPVISNTGSGGGNIYYLNQQTQITGNGTLFSKVVPANTLSAGSCMRVEFSIRSVTLVTGQLYTVNWGSNSVAFLSQGQSATSQYAGMLICNNPGATGTGQINWSPGTYQYIGSVATPSIFPPNLVTQDTTAAATLSVSMSGGSVSDVNRLDWVKVSGPL